MNSVAQYLMRFLQHATYKNHFQMKLVLFQNIDILPSYEQN